ncbi:cytochrome c oxidase assembly protein [Phreatobacter sp.]|uniref:cytochrome c oxidase assembly protein n=1 Tax=Phreatobacter sp. TaxID=1966341 RepID=UPI003F6E6723
MITSASERPYCGPAPSPAELWSAWNLDPLLIAAFAVALCGLPLLGGARERGCFLAGLGLLAVALMSPLCALTVALFSARSFHHLVVAAMAAPLIALALPAARRSGPLLPLVASSLVLWLWHWPAIYAAAFSSHVIYWALQIGLLAGFVWFWRAVLSPNTPPFAALLALGAGAAQMGLLAALLTLAPRPLYAVHGLGPLAWGLDPLTDQQLGGLLMWVPAFFVYGGLAMAAARRQAAGMPA